MIVSQQKRKASPVSRLLAWAGLTSKTKLDSQILDQEAFRFEIKKERSRVDRKGPTVQLSVLLVQGLPHSFAETLPELANDLRERLRITDTIGWCDKKLGVLLAETNREGAKIVAADIESMANRYKRTVEIEIMVYPDDDDIAHNSKEYQTVRFDDSGPLPGTNGKPELTQENEPSVQDSKNRQAFFSASAPTPWWKRTIDVVGAGSGLLLLSPVLLAASAAIKLTSPGPIFFRQLREGKDGVPFYIFKFRTMVNNAEDLKNELRSQSEQDGPAFKLKHDPRLTAVGKYLRKSCIDELPQLANILVGQMSLVGPRPLPVNESHECTIWQRKRLEVAPGLTCIWQVRGDRNTKFIDWMRMDMEYIRQRSLLLDIKLIFETVFVALLHRGSV